MKTRNIVTLVGAIALLTACIPSLNPFYTQKDLVTDARLVGEWKPADQADPSDIWKFEDAGDKLYKLTIREKDQKSAEFVARLIRLENKHFIDLIALKCEFATNQSDIVSMSMIPGHLLMYVSQFEPELKLAFYNYDWLANTLEKNPKALAHHLEAKSNILGEDKNIILTATTAELQQFVLKNLDQLFDKPGEFTRVTNTISGTGKK